jgi:hypothetical protein
VHFWFLPQLTLFPMLATRTVKVNFKRRQSHRSVLGLKNHLHGLIISIFDQLRQIPSSSQANR